MVLERRVIKSNTVYQLLRLVLWALGGVCAGKYLALCTAEKKIRILSFLFVLWRFLCSISMKDIGYPNIGNCFISGSEMWHITHCLESEEFVHWQVVDSLWNLRGKILGKGELQMPHSRNTSYWQIWTAGV